MRDYKIVLHKQREYWSGGESRDIEFRTKQLVRMYRWICKNEDLIMDGLRKDLHKSSFESYATEIGIVKEEIR